MFETLTFYLQYDFVQYALLAGTLIALCSSLLGTILVLKRLSFIGDGLSHVAFTAICIATILKLTTDSFLVIPITAIISVFLLKIKQSKMNGDAALAMISVSSLAIGYFLLNLFAESANISGDVCGILFGSTSILTLTLTDVIICIILSIITTLFFVLFYNKIFITTFDENFAKATGIKTDLYNLLISLITAVVVVLSMNLVGSLLTTALIVFPSLSAMRVMQSFKSTIIYSAILSIINSLLGMIISIIFSTTIGSTIVIINIITFLINYLIGKILRR